MIHTARSPEGPRTVSPAGSSPVGGLARPAAAAGALSPRLVAAAHQFEASLMQELLKPLQADPLFAGDDDPEGAGSGLAGLGGPAAGSGNALMSFATEALAKALSEKGGLGIARRVLDHFRARAAAAETAAETATEREAGDWLKPGKKISPALARETPAAGVERVPLGRPEASTGHPGNAIAPPANSIERQEDSEGDRKVPIERRSRY